MLDSFGDTAPDGTGGLQVNETNSFADTIKDSLGNEVGSSGGNSGLLCMCRGRIVLERGRSVLERGRKPVQLQHYPGDA